MRAEPYAELRRAVVRVGLLERTYRWYGVCAFLAYGVLGVGLLISFASPRTLGWSTVAGAVMGIAMVQIGLIGHDAGHLAVFRGVRANRFLGQLCWTATLAVGFSYWNDRHTRHHAHTNDPIDDPDIAGFGLIAYTAEQAAASPSWKRAVIRCQDALAALLILFLAFFFRVESYLFALRKLHGLQRRLELALLASSTVLWLSPAALLGLSWLGTYVLSQIIASAYLSFVIAPNHYGMPIRTVGQPLTYLERQVVSSRNTTPGWVWDLAFGGLNRQIEHHLFPTMPRQQLVRARTLVKPFCEAHGLPYTEANPFRTYIAVLSEGHKIARSVANTQDRLG